MAIAEMPLEELRQYKGSAPRPADFTQYWQRALSELDTLSPGPRLQPAAFSCPGAQCHDLYFTGVRGAQIYAKFLCPPGAGPHPCLLHFHGYGANSGDWTPLLAYVAQGFCVAAMDVRGQGGKSQDVGGVTGNTLNGQIIRGLGDDPQDLLFRHIYLDTLQLARAVTSLPQVDGSRLVAFGASQGGALAGFCSAWHGGIRRTVVQYPFLSDFPRALVMGGGSFAYAELFEYLRRFDPRHQHKEAFLARLAYIDACHHAPQIQNPVLMAAALSDEVCPCSTQFAFYNNLGGPKQLEIYPNFGHEYLPGFADLALDFLCQAL